MCDFDPQALDFEGLLPDDPHAPRRYSRDPFADDDAVLNSDDIVS